MTLRDTLLSFKPKVKPIQLRDQTFYFRELNVQETNEFLFGQRTRMIRIAEQQGIELDLENEDQLAIQLKNIFDPYAMARTLAVRLCDENGQSLFDKDNEDDLKALSQLDTQIYNSVLKESMEAQPKNLPNAEDSN
ncbi:hypothetical protein OQ257_11305 [Actinobacillus equuli subsp. equuli]|uniref:Uncharacterized protein n=1 Tax=Actinobacillus equuli subsp. equuli TaxID=202947 RepID=A0A9X4JDD5_ACTEU|nr:hypothetical protein [Actinobacillus equuli]MDE8035742.1 hypothetical protein [Actinobacillus equuli subsp. equuli]